MDKRKGEKMSSGTQHLSALHRAARAYAEQGIPVFPCVENGKRPATGRGFHDATTDVAVIDAWWTENPSYNIGLSPEDAGWAVLDIDPGAEEAWETLVREHPELGGTYTVRTPRGGLHAYYEGSVPPTTRSSSNAVLPGVPIDTRGRLSYVLVPPSVVDGAPYRVLDDVDVRPLPPFIAERTAPRAKAATTTAEVVLDLPANIARGRALVQGYVRSGKVSSEGGRNHQAYAHACELLNLGLSVETATALLAEIWNPANDPPLDEAELTATVEHAATYAQNDAGVWQAAPASETFGAAPAVQAALRDSAEKRNRFHFDDETEQELAPDPEWLVEGVLPMRATAVMIGPSGSFKSFLALDLALGIATATETFGQMPRHTGCVFYAAMEGRNATKRVRRVAWKSARGVSAAPHFFVGPAPFVRDPTMVEDFLSQIEERRAQTGQPVRLIVIDTYAKAMTGLDENSSQDVTTYTSFADMLVEKFGCTVLTLAHPGVGDKTRTRGSTALDAGTDTILRVEADRATRAVAVHAQQHKDADEPDRPWRFIGRLVGASLAFFPATDREHAITRGDTDLLAPRHVGASLRELGALGKDRAVTAEILADAMVPHLVEESAEERAATVSATARSLRRLARGPLEPYTYGHGRSLMWALPTE